MKMQVFIGKRGSDRLKENFEEYLMCFKNVNTRKTLERRTGDASINTGHLTSNI
jgi:hypothetical protein